MPNWCSTAYTLVGDKGELDALYKTMSELEQRNQPVEPFKFGNTWLGNLVEALGEDTNTVYCRGEWHDLDYHNGAITFNTDTAWSPCNGVWDLVRCRYPSIDYYYLAEECGNGLYLTNDADGLHYPERYLVEMCVDGCENRMEYFYSLTEAPGWIGEMAGCSVEENEVEALNELLQEQDEDAYCYLNEIQIV